MALPEPTEKLLRHPEALLNTVRRIVLAAGDAIMAHYDEAGFQGKVYDKPDGSPVTEADYEADEIIRAGLAEALPGIPALTEETADDASAEELAAGDYYWAVDPIDATKEFRQGGQDFTVNIGLIYRHVPLLGVVYAPAHGEGCAGYAGDTPLATRWRDDNDRDYPLRVRAIPAEGITLLSSKSHKDHPLINQMIEGVKLARHVRRASSIKFCEIASARADLYVRVRGLNFWDTAAGDAVLRAAGGHVIGFSGASLMYDPANGAYENACFAACTDPEYILPVLQELGSGD